jgi:4a-hydroxytetrahydrobiopterin dehydratase
MADKPDAGPTPLAKRECIPCRESVAPLKGEQLRAYQDLLDGDWKVVNEHHLEKVFRFKNFREALAYTNRVGELAEEHGHHPDLCLGWGRVQVTIYTHHIDGLHESDFVLAAKIENLPLR